MGEAIFRKTLKDPENRKTDPEIEESARLEKSMFKLIPKGSRCQIRNLRKKCCRNHWSRPRLVAIEAISRRSSSRSSKGHPDIRSRASARLLMDIRQIAHRPIRQIAHRALFGGTPLGLRVPIFRNIRQNQGGEPHWGDDLEAIWRRCGDGGTYLRPISDLSRKSDPARVLTNPYVYSYYCYCY